MKRVLVLDACQRSALSVTRSLGRQGIPVMTADETPMALAGCSRFSSHYFRYPSPGTDSDRFIAALGTVVREQDIRNPPANDRVDNHPAAKASAGFLRCDPPLS